jgi:hypothetical protein
LVAQEDYDALAAKAEHVRMATIELSDEADKLHVPIPQALARAWADLLTWPDQIREVGARRAGTWVEPIMERADEPPPDPEEP